MKVILLENLRRIGSIGEIIEVKRGFARNYLISNKKALYASKENISQVEKLKAELGKKDAEKKKEAQKMSEQINGKEYLIKKLSTENKELYGSVKPTEISKLILENEKIDITQYQDIGIVKNEKSFDDVTLDAFMNRIEELRHQGKWDKSDLVKAFFRILPGFAHKETGKYLDQKM